MFTNKCLHCNKCIFTLMRKKETVCILFVVIFVIIFLKLLLNLKLKLSDDEFTSIHSCPACYGTSLCPQFYHGDITLIGSSKLKYFFNAKNVYFGKYSTEHVVLKKLAHDWELKQRDVTICQRGNQNAVCDIRVAIKNLVHNVTNVGDLVSIVNLFDNPTDVSHCSSKRLLLYIFEKRNVQEGNTNSKEDNLYKLSEMLYNLLVNPEAIILQAFPQVEGWPFPLYYGSCGRIIVEEYIGKTIAYFEDSDWKQRVFIVYQLLLIAQTLTENSSRFALYMTDVNMDNFAMRSDGTVFLIDVENLVIVDRSTDTGRTFAGDLHHSDGKFCVDCLNFSFEDLCSYNKSDHNYYAICKGLLVPGSYYSSKGFLHTIPYEIELQHNLSTLIKECVDPSHAYGRFHIMPKLLQTLKSLTL